MLSVIVCNYNPNRIPNLEQNIKEKIGFQNYELVIIDNRNNEYSIFQAYNLGVKRSNYEKLLFIHDDINFHTIDFGKILLNLSLPNLGVLGIAGSKIKTSISSPWWISNHESVNGNIIYQYNIQHFNNSIPKKIIEGFESENQVEEVILVDGVFLFSTRDNCVNYPFDETYNSFHFYDLDFALSLNKNGKINYVTNSILLEHYSAGNLNKDWVTSSFLFEIKWKEFMTVKSIDNQKKKYLERLAFNSRFKVLLDNKFNKKALVLLLSNMRFLSINNLKYLIRSF
jgi:hypothetical protein